VSGRPQWASRPSGGGTPGRGHPGWPHRRPAEARPMHDIPDPRVTGSEVQRPRLCVFQVGRSGWVEQEVPSGPRIATAS
jgi:hypothetical protein